MRSQPTAPHAQPPVPGDGAGGGIRVVPFSGARRATSDYLAVARRKHLVHALVEVDVTRARGLIRAHRERTGEPLSFTAFVVACLARAVDADRSVQAYRQGRRRLVLFDDVDVCVLVERGDGTGRTVAAPHVVRGANRMSYLEIHRALRAARAAAGTGEMNAGGLVPGFAARWFWRLLSSRPRMWKALAGTVSVSSVGMFGQGAGWGIPISAYTLMLTVGGIATRPAFARDGRLEPRELLCLTVSVDHDVVDGAPAARFVQRLRALLERGDGLPEGAPARTSDEALGAACTRSA
ncbi:MAG TPA: 2-oxo acid dehydrogenase subunit E2 [Longimicrobium sp.]